MLLAFLSWALGLLKASMGPYDGDDCSLLCKVENWVKGEKVIKYCAR